MKRNWDVKNLERKGNNKTSKITKRRAWKRGRKESEKMKNEEKADREWLRNNLNKDTRQGKKKKDI